MRLQPVMKSRTREKLVVLKECQSCFTGLLPPFGHPRTVNVIVDPSLAADCFTSGNSKLFYGSGTHSAVIELSFDQLLEAVGGKVVDISKCEDSPRDVAISKCSGDSDTLIAIDDGQVVEMHAGEAGPCLPETSSGQCVKIEKVRYLLNKTFVSALLMWSVFQTTWSVYASASWLLTPLCHSDVAVACCNSHNRSIRCVLGLILLFIWHSVFFESSTFHEFWAFQLKQATIVPVGNCRSLYNGCVNLWYHMLFYNTWWALALLCCVVWCK